MAYSSQLSIEQKTNKLVIHQLISLYTDQSSSTASGVNIEKKVKTKLTIFDDVLQKGLAKHIHGSKKSIDKLIASFVEIHSTASKGETLNLNSRFTDAQNM